MFITKEQFKTIVDNIDYESNPKMLDLVEEIQNKNSNRNRSFAEYMRKKRDDERELGIQQDRKVQ